MSEVNRISIDTGAIRLQINDGPEYIEFNPSDLLFVERYLDLIRKFEEKMAEFEAQSKEIEANATVDDYGIPDNAEQTIALIRSACEFLTERIDHVFGKGTSQKAFGDAMTLDMFAQFFEGIAPYIQTTRSKKMAQYQRKVSGRKK